MKTELKYKTEKEIQLIMEKLLEKSDVKPADLVFDRIESLTKVVNKLKKIALPSHDEKFQLEQATKVLNLNQRIAEIF